MIDARRQCGPIQHARICGGRRPAIPSFDARVLEPAGASAYQRACCKLRSVLKR